MPGFVNSPNKISFGSPIKVQNNGSLVSSVVPQSSGNGWHKNINFANSYGGFDAKAPPFQTSAFCGVYNPTVGWQPSQHINSGYYYECAIIQLNFASTEITSVSITYDLTLGIEQGYSLGAAIGVGVDINAGGTPSINSTSSGSNLTLTWTGSSTVSFIQIFLDIHGAAGVPWQGSGLLKSVSINGNGSNPLTASLPHQWINYDFTVSNQGFTQYSLGSNYVAGQGWRGISGGGGIISEIQKTFSSSVNLDIYEVFMTWTGNSSNMNGWISQNGGPDNGGTVDSFPADAKTNTWVSRRSSTVSSLEVVVGDGAVGGTMTITKVAVRKVL